MSNDPDTKYEYNGKFYKLEPDPNFNNDLCSPCALCHFEDSPSACADMIDKCGDEYYFIPIKSEVKQPVVQLKSESKEVVAQVETQGIKYDQDKVQYSLVPPHALEAVARNLTVGLQKYKERDNWKKVPDAKQRYLDALYRHLEAHRRGELYDTDSSASDMPHMAAVAVNAMFILEFMLDEKLKEKE